jgi:hypothetical protein
MNASVDSIKRVDGDILRVTLSTGDSVDVSERI